MFGLHLICAASSDHMYNVLLLAVNTMSCYWLYHKRHNTIKTSTEQPKSPVYSVLLKCGSSHTINAQLSVSFGMCNKI